MVEVSTVIFMVLILGFIWGGLFYFVNRAVRRDRSRILREVEES